MRNSSNLLFAALVLRVFGAKRVADEHSLENKTTAKEFFTRFPSLHGYLLLQLTASVDALEAEKGTRYDEGGREGGNCHVCHVPVCLICSLRLQPSLFPVLLILSRIYPSPLGEMDPPLSLRPFVPLLLR